MKFAILLTVAVVTISCKTRDGYTPATARSTSSAVRPRLPVEATERTPSQADTSYWIGDGVSGTPLIKINISRQKAYFYKGDTLVGVSPISTGKEGYNTSAGNYRVLEKSPNHRSSLYGVFKDQVTHKVVNADADTSRDRIPPGCDYEGAPMYNFLRFNGGVGMHTGYLPGYSASHGCVRMPDMMARKFFDHAPLGTPVIVI